jgi:hypothetical protein
MNAMQIDVAWWPFLSTWKFTRSSFYLVGGIASLVSRRRTVFLIYLFIYFLGVRRLGREADHSPPSSAEVRE